MIKKPAKNGEKRKNKENSDEEADAEST